MFFTGFNELRFLAAFTVMIGHLELIRVKYNFFNLYKFPFAHKGPFAVIFFFVLSGFLITYLLLQEKEKTATVNIKSFYMRRVYRIWPLYYILVILGLFAIPFATKLLQITYDPLPVWPGIAMFILMVPNLFTSVYGSSFLTPLWSIGVEEQFYLIWAPLMKWLNKYFLWIGFGIIALRLTFNFLVREWSPNSYPEKWIVDFLISQKFECMAIGAIGAWFLFSKKEKLHSSFLYSKWLQIIVLLIVLGGIFFDLPVLISPALSTTFQSIVFLLLIVNVGTNPKPLVSFRNKFISFLGSISYGIYMYHSVVIFVIVCLAKSQLERMSPLMNTVTLYTSAIVVTIVVSWLSFKFIEEPIIRLKHKLK